MTCLPPAPDLKWTEDGAPRATSFDDIYFSRAGGLAETEAVFFAGCDLPNAWRDRRRFAICELGFGTGLNALAVWRAWKATRAPHAILHMHSIEAFPLSREDAARALASFPDLDDLTKQLLARWPVRAYAPQRVWFPDDGFALTLHTGEAESVLAGASGAFDAFFLDGFSPARNTAMWSARVMQEIARLSAPGARAATFSVAGDVRRNLEAAGFSVEKKPGFGAKRERLEAIWTAGVPAGMHSASRRGAGGPYYPYAASHPKRVAILGAGIAGASLAHALARRNVETIVLDAAPTLGAGASGNPAGLVMPRLDRSGALKEFFLAAYLDAVAAYEALGVFKSCGVEQRADRNAEALANLIADPPLPPDWFSALPNGAALHTRAGLVDVPAALIAMLTPAQLMLDAPVAAIESSGDAWLLHAPDGRVRLKADAVMLACGAALKTFAPASFLPIELSRGQIEWGPIEGLPPEHALLSSNYVAPCGDGILFGATFDKHLGPPAPTLAPIAPAGETPAIQEEARARNIAALSKLAPELAARLDSTKLQSRAAIRASTPDFAPIAGLMPDAPAWLNQHAALAHGGEPNPDTPPAALNGVYVLGGLGARGLTLAPMLAERIAAEMFGEPQALSSTCLRLLHPARFLHRALKRGG